MNEELLRSVSRSFYLTIHFLPSEMREAVGMAYMLARATDSIADTSSAEPAKRTRILQQMGQAIAHSLPPDQREALLAELSSDMARCQSAPGERELLQKFGACLDELEHLPAALASPIRKVLQTIIDGQLWDISFFTPQCTAVAGDVETWRYAYQVAGCVGEFWTELGLAAMGSRFCDPARADAMARAGIRYGQGLQLINILRDRDEDLARGRNYLCSDSRIWLGRALRYMADGVDYSRRLGSFRLRFASMLPALIGQKTLHALRHAKKGSGRVKIPRRQVYACMAKALWLSVLRRAS